MASYRDIRPATTNSSDDSSSDSDSDSEENQPWKRRKTTVQSQGIRTEKPLSVSAHADQKHADHERPAARQQGELDTGPSAVASGGMKPGAKKPRRNDVWSQVAHEQTKALVAQEMDGFDMELSRSRDVETYNYKLGWAEQSSRVYLGAPSVSKEESAGERKLKRGFGETEDDGWLVNPQRNSGRSGVDDARRPVHERLGERDFTHRKNAKDRLGSRSESPDQTPMKFIPISPSMHLKEIMGKLAYSLQEPKRDLIVRVVKILGVEKSLELWKLTGDIEKDGGMMIMNGSRRRSPGGVFLQLMKTDPQITKKQVNEIFAEERRKENEQKHKREKKRRHKKTTKFKEEGMEEVGGKQEEAVEGVKEELEEEEEGWEDSEALGGPFMRVKDEEQEGGWEDAKMLGGQSMEVKVEGAVRGHEGKEESWEDGEVPRGHSIEVKEEVAVRGQAAKESSGNSGMEEGEIDDDDEEEDDKAWFNEGEMD